MITIYPAESRYFKDHGWLACNFSFSFADYHDSANINFGPLRVFNDDFIQPSKGFGMHPHRDMEIVSFVLQGQLSHEDNTGGKETLRPGEIQRMTAGTGILHSEMNSSSDEVANTLQLWFLPSETGLPPSYEQKAYDPKAMINKLLPVVSNKPKTNNTVFINQDLTIYLCELEAGKKVSFTQEISRRIYVFVIEGDLTLNKESVLQRRDAARITDIGQLEIQSEKGAHVMLIDLP